MQYIERWSVLTVLPVLLLVTACSDDTDSGDGATTDSASDVGDAGFDTVAEDTTIDTISDQTSEDTTIEPEPTAIVKGPWLQWVSPDSFIVMAESELEVPLVLDIVVDEEVVQTLTSTPFRPDFSGLPLTPQQIDGWLHQVEVSEVDPGQTFEARVLNDGSTANGAIPRAGDAMTMVVLGDNRTQHDQHAMVVAAIEGEHPVVVANTGDMVDLGGVLSGWERYFEIERSLMMSSFFFYTMGNHEMLGQPYLDAFFETQNNLLHERNWSALVGDVGMVAIDQYETDWEDPSSIAWLTDQLTTLGEDASWLFVFFHEPMYTFSSHDPWLFGREHIQPILEEHGVDVVFSGHNHCYEHFRVNEIDYVVTGGGGAPLYNVGDGPAEEMDLLVTNAAAYHYMRLEVTASSLSITAVGAPDGDWIDSWTLTADE